MYLNNGGRFEASGRAERTRRGRERESEEKEKKRGAEKEREREKEERSKASEYKQATEGSSLPARSFGTMIRSKIFARTGVRPGFRIGGGRVGRNEEQGTDRSC